MFHITKTFNTAFLRFSLIAIKCSFPPICLIFPVTLEVKDNIFCISFFKPPSNDYHLEMSRLYKKAFPSIN